MHMLIYVNRRMCDFCLAHYVRGSSSIFSEYEQIRNNIQTEFEVNWNIFVREISHVKPVAGY